MILFVDAYFSDILNNEDARKKTLSTIKRALRTRCDSLFAAIATTVYGNNAVKAILSLSRLPKNTQSVSGAGSSLERFGGEASASNVRASNAIGNSSSSSSSSSGNPGGSSAGVKTKKASAKRTKPVTVQINNAAGITSDAEGEEGPGDNLDFLNTEKDNEEADDEEDEEAVEAESVKLKMLSSEE